MMSCVKIVSFVAVLAEELFSEMMYAGAVCRAMMFVETLLAVSHETLHAEVILAVSNEVSLAGALLAISTKIDCAGGSVVN